MKMRHRPRVLRDYREHSPWIKGPVLQVLPEHRMADGRVMLEVSGDDHGNFKSRLVPRAELEVVNGD